MPKQRLTFVVKDAAKRSGNLLLELKFNCSVYITLAGSLDTGSGAGMTMRGVRVCEYAEVLPSYVSIRQECLPDVFRHLTR